MALAHLAVKIFSRAKGHSAVSKAAYRAAAVLRDERLGVTWNYERKRHVEDRFILAPEGAPTWVFDREALWNTVNLTETRRDAQLCRELEISLPRELTPDQQRELLESFVSELFVSRGMVADCVIHRPPGESPNQDEQPDGPPQKMIKAHAHNPHAHVMLTMRELKGDGFGLKRRDWNDWDLRNNLRPAWELAANRALANAGRQERIDMRSFEDRGIALEPQPKRYRSPAESHLDGRDHVLERAVEAHLVARRNGERVLARPEIVLELLTSKQSVFTEHQLLEALHRYTADGSQFERARLAVFASPELVELATDQTPRRFSTRAVVATERLLLADGHLLAHRAGHQVGDGLVHQAIAEAPKTLGLSHALSDEQAAAVRYVTQSGDFAIVEGYAGTGKSTMLAAARTAWHAQGYKVVGGALAGKAADGLAESAGIESRTLASWQWNWERGQLRLTSEHVFVIDEAGMVGTSQFAEIVSEVRAAGAKLVVVGDTRQLQAIDPGAPMRLLESRYGAATLSQVIRQRDHAWQRKATLAFATGHAADALRQYVEQERVRACPSASDGQQALVEKWDADRRSAPTATTIMLAFRRADVQSLNERARAVRIAAGELGQGQRFTTERGEREFACGDRVCFLRNDPTLGVKNGTLGSVEDIRGTSLVVRLDNHKQVMVDTRAYNALDHGYAGTIHKSQGVTVDRSYVFASRYMDSAASYVAMTRHRHDVHMFYSSEEFANVDALTRALSRSRTADMAHEVASKAAQPTPAEQRRMRVDAAFLKLNPSQQMSQLEALRVLGEQKPIAAERLVESTPEVLAAADRCTREAQRLAGATQKLEDATRQSRVGRSELGKLHAEVEAARREFWEATRDLAAARTDPSLWEKASAEAQRHNGRIRAAQLRWRQFHRVQQESARTRALDAFVSAANTQIGKRAFRVADERDRARLFDEVAQRKIAGHDVLILRAPEGGQLVVAFRDHCSDARGQRLVRGAPERVPKLDAPERLPRIDRSRGPER